MFPLYNIVSDILYSVVVCVDFLGTHMASLVLFLKPGVTIAILVMKIRKSQGDAFVLFGTWNGFYCALFLTELTA